MKHRIGVPNPKIILGIVLVLLIVAFSVFTLIQKKTPLDLTDKKETYRIGAILPLSGSLGFMGKMEGDGIKLAVENINASGGVNGIPIELKLDDSQGKPDIAVTAAQKMMTVDDIKIIISSFSSVTLGLKPVIERNNRILIGACMHPDFYKNAPNVFRFYIGVEDESRGFVEYLTAQKTANKTPRIGCLYVEAPNVTEQLEEYIEPGLAEAGLSFVVKEPYRLSDKEFRDKILKLRSANLTHLLVIGYGFLYPNIFREMKDQQFLGKVQIVGGWGFLYPNVEPKDLEGVIVVGPKYVFSGNIRTKEFYRSFKEKFGYEANFDAAMTYAAMQIIANALKTVMSNDTDVLVTGFSKLNQINTLIGDISINPDGAITFEVGRGRFHSGYIEPKK